MEFETWEHYTGRHILLENEPEEGTLIIKQKRRNKNRRINKKWLKRYGYYITTKSI
jgi:ABC-type oligopeptide transport system ATPase subunit